MFRSLLLLVALFGISAALTLKEDLNQKLDQSESKLKTAIQDSKNHGFAYMITEFVQTINTVLQYRAKVSEIVEGSTSASNGELFQDVTDLSNKVTVMTSDPFPREHLKARVLYLAAMKQIFNLSTVTFPPEQHIADVLKVIEQERFNSNPFFQRNQLERESDHAKLEQMYKALEESMEKPFVVPTFKDHYAVANRTRVKINEYIRTDRYLEAKAIREDLTSFDSLTLALAGLFPLTGAQNVQQYVSISKGHFQMKQKLESVKRLEPTLREQLLKRVDELEAALNSAYNKANNQRVVYYTKVLVPAKQRVNWLKNAIQQLDEDGMKANSGLLIQTLEELEAYIPGHAKNPSPTEDMKSRGLYLAAMRTEKDPLGAKILIDAVKRIVAFEKTNLVGITSADKASLEYARGMLDSLYLTLENLIKGPVVVPGPDQHQEQIEFAEGFIKQLNAGKYGKWAKYADRYFQVTYAFKRKTSVINQILPIDSDEKVDVYYQGALVHYGQNNEMWSLVEKLKSDDVTQVKGGFNDCTNHRCRFEEMQKILEELQKNQKH